MPQKAQTKAVFNLLTSSGLHLHTWPASVNI
jgi:hypothetical protein